MRDITFRGKRIDNGEWAYGYLFKIWEWAYILWGTTNDVPNMIAVDPETVGQYIGINDLNEKEIYTGDQIIKDGVIYTVHWSKYSLRVSIIGKHKFGHDLAMSYSSQVKRSEIIGNIYENHELIK